jgi:hypothetical protein
MTTQVYALFGTTFKWADIKKLTFRTPSGRVAIQDEPKMVELENSSFTEEEKMNRFSGTKFNGIVFIRVPHDVTEKHRVANDVFYVGVLLANMSIDSLDGSVDRIEGAQVMSAKKYFENAFMIVPRLYLCRNKCHCCLR